MTLRLNILPPAECDAQQIFDWLAKRSPGGARRWFVAYETAAAKLLDNSNGYGLRLRTSTSITNSASLFKTRRAPTYRAVFTVVDEEVRVLRVRGPGQAPLAPDEIE